MRRALLVLTTFLILSAAVIVIIRLRIAGGIESPFDIPANEQHAQRPVWPSIESETTPPTPPPPPPSADGTQVPTGPPEGWVWWGEMAFRKDAKIQSNYEDSVYSGYTVPVQYMRDGTLVVASKYPDHSACIWSYDTAAGTFAVLHRKTRQAIKQFQDRECICDLNWVEVARDYTWQRDDLAWMDKDPKIPNIIRQHAAEMTEPPRRTAKHRTATMYGGAKDDACYDQQWNPIRTEGAFLESRSQKGWAVSLNAGALELSQSYSDIGVNIPLLGTELRMPPRRTLELRDTTTQRLVSSLSVDSTDSFRRLWDFGRGLALAECYSMGGHPGQRIAPRMVLLKYPELRILACATFSTYSCESMNSVSDGLAIDLFVNDPAILGVGTNNLFRIRVPDNWHEARGQRNVSCIWEEHPADLGTLEVSARGTFRDTKWEPSQDEKEKMSVSQNMEHPFVYRDGVMYWRRYTGEVLMASPDNPDAQTVFGGEGATWDGFRVNPARNEVVTWRENGEIVFWKVQFPSAEPICKARVITDTTPHRLEAM